MKCSYARSWLLAVSSTPALPAPVQRHLQDCVDCRHQCQRLLFLQREVQQLPVPPEDPQARARFLLLLEQTPQQKSTLRLPLQPTRGGWQWGYLVRAAAAALLLGIGLGWWLTTHRDNPSSTGARKQTPGSTLAEGKIVGRAVEHDLRLAETFVPKEQVQALAGMADDLHGEALTLAQQGRLDDLAQVTGLYEQVVRRGIMRRAGALSLQELTPVIQQLQEAEAASKRTAAGTLPAAADLLRGVEATARDTAQALQRDPKTPAEPPPPASQANTPRALLNALVMNGVRLAEEEDPLRRADYCSDVADQLVQTILQASATGNTEEASKLGKYLGAVMERGVASNLDRVPTAELTGPRLKEWERVGQRAATATAALERNLERAPGPAQAGLQRAMEASNHGRERAMQVGKGKGKGKGPPSQRDDKDHPGKGKSFVPPGQEKKNHGQQGDKN